MAIFTVLPSCIPNYLFPETRTFIKQRPHNMHKKLTCFKAYDIRGQLGTQLDEEVVYNIARAFGETLRPKVIVVGGDARETSEALKLGAAEGLRDAGVDVLDIGMVGTEEI